MDKAPVPPAAHRPIAERLLLAIFRRYPARDLIFRAAPGRPESEYANELALPFYRFFGDRADLFVDRDVLDVGSGFGGRPVRYYEYGARSVTGIEISPDKVDAGTNFARRRGLSDYVRFVLGSGEVMPVASGGFDLVTMYDTLEHVVDPHRTLAECFRVLRSGGLAAIVFPPYYDVRAGHHLNGYATTFPGLQVLFPTRTLRSATREHLESQGHEYQRFLRDLPTDKLWNLNGLTVRAFKRSVEASGFATEQLRTIGHLGPREMLAARHALAWRVLYRASALAAGAPVLRELLGGRVCALLRKE